MTDHIDPCAQLNALESLIVSRGAGDKLRHYGAMLAAWNEKINLVSPSTIPVLWTRHILDSAQLYPLLPPGATRLVDLGSGAGFPGMVLAILGVPEVHLIESTGKKATFLKAVAAELAPHVTVHAARIEALHGELVADMVTARALAPLPDLLPLAAPFLGARGTALFLKGRKAPEELTQARKYWTFSLSTQASLSDPSGVVLSLSALAPAIRHVRRKQRKTKG